MGERHVFDDGPVREFEYVIGGHVYILREADADAMTQQKNFMAGQAQFGPDGNLVSPGNFADADLLLLSLCLYHADSNGRLRLMRDGTPNPDHLVAMRVLRRWPARIVTKLIARVKAVSELEVVDTVEGLGNQIAELQARRDKLLRKSAPPAAGEQTQEE